MPPRGAIGRVALTLAALVAAASSSACSRTADEDQCKKLVDKLVELIADDDATLEHVEKVKSGVKADKRAAVISRETCVGKVSSSQYECMMQAKSIQAFTACDK